MKITVLLWHNSSNYTIPFRREPNFEDRHNSYCFTPILVYSITCLLVHPCFLELVKTVVQGSVCLTKTHEYSNPCWEEKWQLNEHAC